MAKCVVRFGVSALLVGILFFTVDLGRVFQLVIEPRPASWALVFLLVCLQIDLSATRWSYAIDALTDPPRHHKLLNYTYMGQFVGLFLPASVGAAAVKAWMAYRNGITASDAITSVVFDRLLATASMVGLTVIALPVLTLSALPPDEFRTLGQSSVLLALAALVAAIVLWRLHKGRRFLASMPMFGPALDYLASALSRAANKRLLLLGLGVSILCQIIMLGAIFVLARSAGVAVTPIDILILMPPVMLVAALPISIGGWGVREGAMILAFGLVGVPSETALALSIEFALISSLASLIGAIGWFRTIDAHALSQIRRFSTN